MQEIIYEWSIFEDLDNNKVDTFLGSYGIAMNADAIVYTILKNNNKVVFDDGKVMVKFKWVIDQPRYLMY